MFWVDFSNDRIVRGLGIETPSSYTNLVTSGLECAGMLSLQTVSNFLAGMCDTVMQMA